MKPQPHKDEIILQKILSVLEKKYEEVLQSKKNWRGVGGEIRAQKSEVIDIYV